MVHLIRHINEECKQGDDCDVVKFLADQFDRMMVRAEAEEIADKMRRTRKARFN
jgi:hypothetical protein